MLRDVFVDGAWFHGRIYEDRCDLSPDGNLFVYAAFKRIKRGDEFVYSYTALSRAPWLYAIEMQPATSTYEVGGRFLDDRRYELGRFSKRHQSTDEVPVADWCGHDHRGRIIYTVGGKLFRVLKKGPVEIADFTNEDPDPQPPPEYAKRPL